MPVCSLWVPDRARARDTAQQDDLSPQATWLDDRERTCPNSINPHLFVTRRRAPRLTMVGSQLPWRTTGLTPRALREDRILNEIHAIGGDVRRLHDLFGLEYPDLTDPTDQVPRTRVLQ